MKMGRVTIDMSIQDMMVEMSGGNPGALRVCMDLLKSDPVDGLIRVLDLDDMNIHESHIWLAYKDVCDEDLAVLKDKIKNRDAAFVAELNDAIRQNHYPPDKPMSLAVVGGAS
jgi:hypothetical protein